MRKMRQWMLAILLAFAMEYVHAGPGQAEFRVGFDLFQAGKLQAAIAKYEAGLKTEPKNAQAHFYLAEAYLQLKQINKAKIHYDESINIDPSGELAQKASNRLTQLARSGEQDPIADTGSGAAQDSASDLFHEGFELLQRNEAKRAIEYFERGLKLEPKNALGHFYLAEALRAEGRLGEAREHYQRSLKLDSKSSVAEQARAQLQATADASPKAPLATPVKAAGFDEQAMHEAIALVDEIADLNVWFMFCANMNFAQASAYRKLLKKREGIYQQCVNTCEDRPARQACQKDCTDGLAPWTRESEKCRQAFTKADQESGKVISQGSNKLQILPRDYFVRLGATFEQTEELEKRRWAQEQLGRAEGKEKVLAAEQREMQIFDSSVFCGGSDYFNERVARAKEIQAEVHKVLGGQGNAVVSPSAMSSSSQPERSSPASSGTAGADEGMTPGRVFRDCPACPEMVVVPAGSFSMGSPPGEVGRFDTEGPAHTVTTARPLAVGKYEVTFDEWDACVRESVCAVANDEKYGRSRRPVININYEQAVAYTKWLSAKTHKTYRLLNEAEWEYAARGGATATRFWGASPDRACDFANVHDLTGKRVNKVNLENFACDDNYAQTAPVGSFKPNAFGLYDMLGNVWEWVEDCWHSSYQAAPADGSAWATGNCSLRVYRGGSWYDGPRNVRSAYRNWVYNSRSGNDLGLRVARALP